MAYSHGVKISEVPTSILPPVEVSAGIPFIVGTAPVNMTDPTNVNKPVLCYSYDEAVAAFGYVPPKLDAASGLKKYEYSISEFIYSQFALFGVAPVMIVNVLDPTTHKITATTKSVTLDAKTGSATIAETGILPETVTLTGSGSAYVKGTDYVLTFDDDGYLVITSKTGASGDFLCTTATPLTLAAEKVDPTKVATDDIVGGVDVSGNKKGFELVDECFPRFRLVPGILMAPGFAGNATVAAIMAAKAENINGVFKAISLVDVPTGTVKSYSGVAEWKNNNNIVDTAQVACWPMVSLDGVVFNMSTQLAGLMGQVDGDNDDVPYVSPSNKNFQMTAAVLSDGTEIWLGNEEASYLNSQGVVTALNFIGGWKQYRRQGRIYPDSPDVRLDWKHARPDVLAVH